MAINAHLTRWRARRRSGERNSGENISDTPMVETLQSHRLQSAWSLAGCSERGCGNNSGNSGDDPRVGASQDDETPSSQSLGSHPTKRTLGKQWPSTPCSLGGEQGGPAVETSVKNIR